MERRLAAILTADVVGFSRQTEADEEGTLTRLKALRDDLLSPSIEKARGRLVKLMGDGALVEFASVVDAVRCAAEIQRALGARNAQLPESERLQLRIGVNLGDVVVEGDDIYGEGVNVAARLEALAEPGGVCISGAAYDHVKGKVDAGFRDLGERQVKNISAPVRVYKLELDGAKGAAPGIGALGRPSRRKVAASAGLAFTALLAVAVAFWQPWAGRQGAEDAGTAALPLPDKPSIAVLPFENLNQDETQAYFSDGMTEDLINHLGRYRELFVIARNSSFRYKGQAVDVQRVGDELGVAFVVDGSIQRSDDRVRINAQLIDARSSEEIWSEQFERDLTDVFALQDEITRSIAGQLVPEVLGAEIQTARQTPTEDLDSWDLYLQAIAAETRYTPENVSEAIRLAEAAIGQDPGFAAPYVVISRAKGVQYFYGWTEDKEATLDEALQAAQTAIKLDDKDASAYAALGYNYRYLRDETRSVANLERAVSINPNDANIRLQFAHVLDWFHLQERGLPQIKEAIRLSPRDPRLQLMYFYKGHILFHLRRHEESLEATREMAGALTADLWRGFYHQLRAANFAQLGEMDAAREEIDAALALNPKLSLNVVRQLFNIANNHPENRSFWLESLKLAGLPET